MLQSQARPGPGPNPCRAVGVRMGTPHRAGRGVRGPSAIPAPAPALEGSRPDPLDVAAEPWGVLGEWRGQLPALQAEAVCTAAGKRGRPSWP